MVQFECNVQLFECILVFTNVIYNFKFKLINLFLASTLSKKEAKKRIINNKL